MPTYDFTHIFNDDNVDSPDSYEVDTDTIGQFTGLTDKNGKDIYSGDIVRSRKIMYSDNEFETRVVEFGNGSFNIGNVTLYILTMDSSFAPEVIGNIHEYKHLLK
jgi:uncharacterized phage protein (TIGR01671 family)